MRRSQAHPQEPLHEVPDHPPPKHTLAEDWRPGVVAHLMVDHALVIPADLPPGEAQELHRRSHVRDREAAYMHQMRSSM